MIPRREKRTLEETVTFGMPKRTDIKKILIIGSGPIVIGQACEFDYSGTQAIKALKSLGYYVILVNSNPATIMTDPELADETYIEPLTVPFVTRIIEKSRPDVLLPTLGGQTALNLATSLSRAGVLEKYQVELIGASLDAIEKAEDRKRFRDLMLENGLPLPQSVTVETAEEGMKALQEFGIPLILRPAFTLGGAGGSLVFDASEFPEKLGKALSESPIHQVLVEEALVGWKEFELEVMRDVKGNTVIVCSIENVDPMGIHTGDSVTVAPALTLSDKEYQVLRDMAIKIMQAVGVATGGSNIQFAVNPKDGRVAVIEMNPRVSRSSALASKATGFPIAKIAAMLAVGLTLDEIPNDITKATPAAYEPTIDYIVVKIPRFAFEKFPGVDEELSSQMKSVGEVMAIGRTFPEALQKAYRSLEKGYHGLDDSLRSIWENTKTKEKLLSTPLPERLFHVKYALASGMKPETIHSLSYIDPWFIAQINSIVQYEASVRGTKPDKTKILDGKKRGFSDTQLSALFGASEESIRKERPSPEFLAVDTCAGEFPATTPYFYSSYEASGDWTPLPGRRVIILGSGPNRIGQGIEFDYCCVQAVQALREEGCQGIMINSNPETVSTDYDTSSRLYFEPVYFEHVRDILEREKPIGVIVQLGGQTPLKLARPIEAAGFSILGTSVKAIHQAESREEFGELVRYLKLLTPAFGIATDVEEASRLAARIGYPILLRPSYVLSGQSMRIVYDEEYLRTFFQTALESSHGQAVLIDKFLEDALELDVDAISDGQECVIMGIMRHIEEAGIHSGDSACVLPPFNIRAEILAQIKEDVTLIARELGVIGFINVQMALRGNKLYILEVNPRASRTVPFVSKVRGLPYVKAAISLILGAQLKDLPYDFQKPIHHWGVKAVVLPFKKLVGSDAVLGPEMKSTGEVMGIDSDLTIALSKAYEGAGIHCPTNGTVFISVRDDDKRAVVPLARRLQQLGFRIVATESTAKSLSLSGIPVEPVRKIQEGSTQILDQIRDGKIKLVINTPSRKKDEEFAFFKIRRAAITMEIPLITTVSQAQAIVSAIEARHDKKIDVRTLQDYHLNPVTQPVPS